MLGKIAGFVFGSILAGFWGGVFGALLGHSFDRALRSSINFEMFTKKDQAKIQETFFKTTFLVLGYISKYDGKISEKEIEAARRIMRYMSLSSEKTIEAIKLFNKGKSRDFELNVCLANFVNDCGASYQLLQMFLEFQLTAAYADGHGFAVEKGVLENICIKIGLPLRVLRRLVKQFEAENNFKGYSRYSKSDSSDYSSAYQEYRRSEQYKQYNSYTRNNSNSINDAYIILGVAKADSKNTIKKAYRRLMSQNHPDKLIAKGLPEDMVKMATEKSQNIQAAYDMICKARGFK